MILHKLFHPIVENMTIHPSGLTICSLKEQVHTGRLDFIFPPNFQLIHLTPFQDKIEIKRKFNLCIKPCY